ncbi:bifunctional protein-serine/threonine kinase/phosphatase [Vibrio sp. B1FLJ16]|uniref:bifunctional protein-serine/threonine kinase/phosphatase n=1 Tax=Vibrio sp. B1FLJ16 TaxID=2751178 RepID=UPI001AFABCC2|nr:bifunctional protein-serine/threonine kinase/phosphatase [Vibrio sp. B1FLJ16]CAD7821269.1 Serine Threonine protein [Vibrio sp. B1FLJ16]CAE6945754.1 Serine Threonine protein [Vibrio sp. B1FLJ16]
MLNIKIGQASVSGRKPVNQDCIGAYIPEPPSITTKGVVAAICDGISSSSVSQIASETAIKSFIADYYSTSEAWSVKKSGVKILEAINYWLYSQTKNSEHRFDFNKGYVCTFSAVVFKSQTAHLFHCGDSRIYRLCGKSLEQLTQDHRQKIDDESSYLEQALGLKPELSVDYRTFSVSVGDVLVLATDGIFDFLSDKEIAREVSALLLSPQERANNLIRRALEAGSDDNLSIQILEIESLPEANLNELMSSSIHLSPAPILTPNDQIDDFEILRELHISERSHVFLAKDRETKTLVVLKTPSAESRQDESHLESFLMEDWIAKKLSNPHLLRMYKPAQKPSSIYTVSEYIEGLTLSQWIKDNPTPDINTVREIIVQVARGLQAMHRQEMVHQDLRPENIMIDQSGTVKIIDYGATKVAGLSDIVMEPPAIMGTAQYTAPEYFIGQAGSNRSDIFSLGVITYQMLTGKLPYGTQVSRSRNAKSQQKLEYVSAPVLNPAIPNWIDFALKRALKIDPHKRYEEVSEFVFDLTEPNPQAERKNWVPIAERNPILFWQRVSLVLFVALICSLLY